MLPQSTKSCLPREKTSRCHIRWTNDDDLNAVSHRSLIMERQKNPGTSACTESLSCELIWFCSRCDNDLPIPAHSAGGTGMFYYFRTYLHERHWMPVSAKVKFGGLCKHKGQRWKQVKDCPWQGLTPKSLSLRLTSFPYILFKCFFNSVF